MCGIFGMAVSRNTALGRSDFSALLHKLYLLSESRGKESAGLHLLLPSASSAWTIKGALPASELILTKDFKAALTAGLDLAYGNDGLKLEQPLIAIAHSRLVTNGRAELPENNQPVRADTVTIVHNGIVVNVDQLWSERPHLKRTAEVDTEVIAAMIAEAMQTSSDPIQSTREAFRDLKGAASIAWTHGSTPALTLATNTGDLFFAALPESAGIVFASEKFILDTALTSITQVFPDLRSRWLEPGNILTAVLTDRPTIVEMALKGREIGQHQTQICSVASVAHNDIADVAHQSRRALRVSQVDESLLRYNEQAMLEIRRCSRCVLPETFPFISFDPNGVCNYCSGYQQKFDISNESKNKTTFLESIEKYRSQGGKPDVLVPFSGGRDSCYGLHLIKREFGLNPITFTYDWGMVTDLARRNIARFCGQLGVQNILVSADIRMKRDNIRKNVSAWLKRPDLGMVPLFMAGDKQFYLRLSELKKQTGIKLNIWSVNPLENTDFKVGLCGVRPDFNKKRVDQLSGLNKVRLLSYYGRGLLLNPRYLNSSLTDTASAYFSYYIEPRDDFCSLFHHLVWNEEVVNKIIVGEYEFERALDSTSTWRIGDGTAPFYNYIYMTARGFTEFDTFRSNQIREGQISRREALAAIVVENRPRVEGLRWYLETIDIDFNDAISAVNKLDKIGLHA